MFFKVLRSNVNKVCNNLYWGFHQINFFGRGSGCTLQIRHKPAHKIFSGFSTSIPQPLSILSIMSIIAVKNG